MSRFVQVTGLLTLLWLPTNLAQEKYIACSQVNNYCASNGVTFQSLVPVVPGTGRPGKSGPKGEPGSIGEPGPPGVASEVDLEAFERRLLEKVKDWLSKCQFVYNDSCFLLVGSFGGRYSKDDFLRECSRNGANLANLYGEDHRKKLSRFILREIGNVYKELALGMTYDLQTARFTTAQGEEVSMVVTWHTTYPKTDQSFRNIFMSVNPDSSAVAQGAYNYKPQYLEFGVCEYRLEI